MRGSGLAKTTFLALSVAGFIASAAAREYFNYTPKPAEYAPSARIPKPEPGPDRVALETMERLVSSQENSNSQVIFYIRGIDPDTESMFPAGEAELSGMTVWQLQILDRDGQKAHFIQGQNRPTSASLSWDGLTTDGKPLPAGFYSARLVWKDVQGEVHSTTKAGFTLFSQLQYPKFSKLKLDTGFLKNFEIL